ncbi:MAG: 50S ribosomal protein L15e [Candidatus Aenigmarchaeota archaeon]|nr:50S ribosomal protein L15e [Candidatus Aenigmarchaeota archaeon]
MDHAAEMWKKPKASLGGLYKQRLIAFRKEPSIVRVEKPTKIARARALGYQAKQGFVVARVRVVRGKRKRPHPAGGRRPAAFGHYFAPGVSKQRIAEQRAARKFPNLEIVNSYWVGEDGVTKWFEVILIDPDHPVIRADRQLMRYASHRGRTYRGRTSAGRKGRGLR